MEKDNQQRHGIKLIKFVTGHEPTSAEMQEEDVNFGAT